MADPGNGYAPVNGLQMYYEVHGSGGGRPLVLRLIAQPASAGRHLARKHHQRQ